jgi:hypothetical protein
MTFARALAAWERWEDQSILGGLVFCDWCQEQGMDAGYTENWRKFCCPMYGSDHITSELRRLATAEASRAQN